MKFHKIPEAELESELQSLMTQTSDAIFALVEAIAIDFEKAFPVTVLDSVSD